MSGGWGLGKEEKIAALDPIGVDRLGKRLAGADHGLSDRSTATAPSPTTIHRLDTASTLFGFASEVRSSLRCD